VGFYRLAVSSESENIGSNSEAATSSVVRRLMEVIGISGRRTTYTYSERKLKLKKMEQGEQGEQGKNTLLPKYDVWFGDGRIGREEGDDGVGVGLRDRCEERGGVEGGGVKKVRRF
jgi:hypothetical protein